MANIENLNEAWQGHSGLEVETFLKAQLTALAASLGGKFGYVAFNSQTMTITFYDEAGGTALGSVQLGGQVYTISMACNLSQVFYVLADETEKIMTITPSTTVSSFGSSTQEPFPEPYTYVVAVNSGAGYIDRVTGSITTGGSASFDLKPYLSTGDNYIRVAVTGTSSGQTKTSVFTGTLTTLTMSCNHTWQNVWTQGLDYNITGIRFAGNLIKELHVSLDNVELTPVTYSANQSYTTTATYYTIPASAFPSGGSAVHSVKLWMTAQGVSTPQVSYNIMCAASGDTTPLVCINAIAARAYNFTNGTIFSYAVYNANKVSIDLSATLNSVLYPIVTGKEEIDREAGYQYQFAYSLEVDTGANETKIGSLAIAAKAYMGSTEGTTSTASTIFDNTYSYLATPGALFYLNAATRNNGTMDYLTVVNEAGASENFAATYSAVWSGLSWYNDGWGTDPNGYKALSIPAGCSVTVTDLQPLSLVSSYEGMTIELMLMCGSPSDYSEPVFTIATSGANPNGIIIYPTKITVLGSAERDVDYQSINFSENTMTHICITILKGYEGQSGKNLCSVYINGISNVNFDFDGSSSFGDGSLVIGQAHTDAYLYKMRIYGSALESGAVFNNFLNCIVDGVEFNRSELNTENDVLLGSSVDYDLVKRAGLNTMVVITPNDVPIPNVDNKVTIAGCTVRFEYAGQSLKNATVGNVSMDGQGTTSKKYYRWNLRWKTGDTTTWTYGDGTTGAAGKEGQMIHDSSYINVDRITAKKNIASSPQGHKMGLTGLYNDLYHQIGLDAELPNPNYRVAVYQFPFVGFQYNSQNQSYTFIGMYTAGPDKGSKVTFGYLKSPYPDCLSIEGPNHAPRGTRFLCPWVDVEYNPSDETLTFGGEEGWDCDYVKYKTGYGDNGEEYPTDWAAIRQLYEDEWRPAYNCVYDNSPYLASYQEVITALDDPSITTLADLLTTANAGTIKAGYTNGMIVKNEFIAFYDSSYDLYFYRRSTGKYEKLPNDYTGKKNALTDLTTYLSALGYSTSSPTTAQIIEARGARFKATMGNYFSVSQTLYHYVFCLLYGVTDNFAKNSYPFKFQKLTSTGAGNRWGWRQDDLDSVLMTDNNGTNTKSYSVEHLDTFDNVQIFQGGDAALWMLIKANYEDECRTMMGQIVTAATSLATSLGIAGGSEHASLFNLTSYYCWDHSAKYFPATIYEADRRWAYIEPWLLAGQSKPGGGTYPGTYNGVEPLTQALGDQYQGEKLWMQRRIAYMFSKYHIAEFHGTNTGYNAIVFTLATGFTFRLTPAIDLYPVVSLVDDDAQGGRTQAGSYTDVYIGSSGDSNNSIHGGDWLASLGDLHTMRLTNRGGSSSIPFTITGARLQTLKIGDETAWDTSTTGFNATQFGVTSPTLVTLDARNTATITNNIDLLGCPRLRTCLFAGSGAAGLLLPVGAKLTTVSFPAVASTVFMHSLPFLQNSGLTLPTLSNITTLYINNCANLNPFSIVDSILGTTGEQLAYATLIWMGIVQASSADNIVTLSERAGEVEFDGQSVSTKGGKPHVEGTVQISGMYANDLDDLDIISEETYQTNLKKALSGLFGTNFYIIYDPNNLWIRFADANVKSICITNWDTNHNNELDISEAEAVTDASTQFAGNTNIVSFDEFRYFTHATTISHITTSLVRGFKNCTSLEYITLPPVTFTTGDNMFTGCASLKRITISDQTKLASGTTAASTRAFQGCTNLKRIDIPSIGVWLEFCKNFAETSWDTLYSIPFQASGEGHLYKDGVEITNAEIPNGTTSVPHFAFIYCGNITAVSIPSSVTSIAINAFRKSGITSISLPSSLTSIGSAAFYQCAGLAGNISIPSSLTSIGANAFNECTNLESVTCDSQNSGIPFSDRCFCACSNLTKIELPITSLGVYVFYNCSKLEEITFGGSVSSTSSYNFAGCSKLKVVNMPSISAWMGCDFSNASARGPFDISQDGHIYIDGTEVTNLNIPNTVTQIKAGCCRYVKSITSITIPSSVTSIGEQAFLGCTGITSLTLPSSITSIGQSAFSQCSGITGSVTVPSSVTSLPALVFNGCSSLVEVTLEGVTFVGYNCRWFNGAASLKKLALPAVTDTSNAAYMINSTVNLDVLDFGPNLTNVERWLFGTGVSVASLVCRATTPPTGYIPINNAAYVTKVYVPYSSDHSILSAYQSDSVWGVFSAKTYELNQDGTIPS